VLLKADGKGNALTGEGREVGHQALRVGKVQVILLKQKKIRGLRRCGPSAEVGKTEFALIRRST